MRGDSGPRTHLTRCHFPWPGKQVQNDGAQENFADCMLSQEQHRSYFITDFTIVVHEIVIIVTTCQLLTPCQALRGTLPAVFSEFNTIISAL